MIYINNIHENGLKSNPKNSVLTRNIFKYLNAIQFIRCNVGIKYITDEDFLSNNQEDCYFGEFES